MHITLAFGAWYFEALSCIPLEMLQDGKDPFT